VPWCPSKNQFTKRAGWRSRKEQGVCFRPQFQNLNRDRVRANEWILPYVIKQCGADTFSYVSDYPHEVDLVAAKQMIHDTVERPDLTHSEKAAVLEGMPNDF
jgi:hypothetical protein